MFILASFVSKSFQHLICTLTQGGQGSHLFRLTCSVVLWGRRDLANKYCWHVWGVLTVDGPHWVCHSPRQHVLPRSTLLRLQPALQGHCPKWTLCLVHLPALSCSGSQVLCKGTDPSGLCISCLSRVQAARGTWCFPSTQSQVAVCLCTSLVPASQFPVCVTRSQSQVYHVPPLGS